MDSDQHDMLYLRPEAQPIEQWDRMTRHQQEGLEKLLRMLHEAVFRPTTPAEKRRVRLPWLFAETKMQLAFIDGERGTGKTTLMTTLVGAIDDPTQFHHREKTDPRYATVRQLAEQLKNFVIPVQPLDMEPLPEGSALLAALLARIYRAAEEYGLDGEDRGGLLAHDPTENRELLRLQQFQQRVAQALDSNLPVRKEHLDADQFAEAVMGEEEKRLALVSDLEQVLCALADRVRKRLKRSRSGHGDGRLLFLIPIDDIDLNPQRCLELLRLLRTFSPPRELFFLLMGQADLVETIVKLQMASEYGKVRHEGADLSTVSLEWLQNDVASVAVANVRKMIPPQSRIGLPRLSLYDVLNFRPLGQEGQEGGAALWDLLQGIPLRDQRGRLCRFPSLGALLGVGGVAEDVQQRLDCTSTASEFPWGRYCGLGTYEVQARRLADLWMELSQLQSPSIPGNGSAGVDLEGAIRIRDLMDKHWQRVVDADPILDPESRRRLKRDSRIWSVQPFPDVVYERDLEVTGAGISVGDSDRPMDVSVYRPRLRLAARRKGTGLPRMELNGLPGVPCPDGQEGAGPAAGRIAIDSPATRSAIMLIHDLTVLYAADTQSVEDWRELTSVAPVTLSWVGPEGVVANFPWPLPPLETFVETAEFLRAWNKAAQEILISRATTSADANSSHPSDGSGESYASVPVETVARLVRCWCVLGLNAIVSGSPQTSPAEIPLSPHAGWLDVLECLLSLRTDALQQARLRAWVQADKWLRRIAQLTQPELCSPAVSAVLIRELEGLSCAESLRTLHAETHGILKYHRRKRLDPIWRSGRTQLWQQLNTDPVRRSPAESSPGWLFLKVDQPAPEKESDFVVKIRELENTIDQLGRDMRSEFQRAEYVSLIRQAELAERDDSAAATRLYERARTIAQRMVEVDTKDVQAHRDYFNALRRLAKVYRRREKWGDAEGAARQTREVADEIVRLAPQSSEAQRDLASAYELVGDIYKHRETWDEVETAYHAAQAIREKMRTEHPDDAVIRREYRVSLDRIGDVLRHRGQLTAARQQYLKSYSQIPGADQSATLDREDQIELSFCLDRLGDVAMQLEQWRDAEKAYERALQIRQELSKENPFDQTLENNLSYSQNRMGDLLRIQGKADDAMVRYWESIRIRQKLSQADPRSSLARRNLTFSLRRLGDLLLLLNQLDEAETALGQALEIDQSMAELELRNTEVQRSFADSLSLVGQLQVRRGDRAGVEHAYRSALRIYESLVEQQPNSQLIRRGLTEALYRWWSFLAWNGTKSDAGLIARRAEALAGELATSAPEVRQFQRDEALCKWMLSFSVHGADAQRSLRMSAWNLLNQQDPLTIRNEFAIQKLYEALRLEFAPTTAAIEPLVPIDEPASFIERKPPQAKRPRRPAQRKRKKSD